jgi:hypothetical protein
LTEEQQEVAQCAQFCLLARQPIRAFEDYKSEFEEMRVQRNPRKPGSSCSDPMPLRNLSTSEAKLHADEEVRQAEDALRQADSHQDRLDAMSRLYEARRNPMRTRPTRLEPSVKQLKLEMDREKRTPTSFPEPLSPMHEPGSSLPDSSSHASC